MTDLEETQHESFSLPTNKDIPIWRYMDLAKYLSMLEHQSLFFSRATLLGDPFEGSATKMMVASREYIRANRATDPALAQWKEVPEIVFEKQANIFKSMVPTYFVNCWHMNEHESAAMWKLYSSSNEAVCIRSSYRRLRQCLPMFVHIGEVKYINYDGEFFAAWQAFNYIMHKRWSYAHERELRAVFWEMGGTAEAQPYKAQITPAGVAMPVDLPSLIDTVYISPAAATWFAEVVKAMTLRCGFQFPVHQSALAAGPVF
jgi:hypothetical protein